MPSYWKCRDKKIYFKEHPLVMGILNVTPDSFSDGGHYYNNEAAITRGYQMIEEGADIIDIGGESTRPGASEVNADDEVKRVIPVIKELAKTNAVISIDTMKAIVAQQAIEVGAIIINDVSALTHDKNMPQVAKETKAGVILMHMRGNPRTMQNNTDYDNVVYEVSSYLKHRIDDLTAKGLDMKAMAIDPGIGFGKTVEHNLYLLANLDKLSTYNVPIIIGLSNKSFIGKLTGRMVEERLAGSIAGLVFCILNGAHIMRVHDIKESMDAVLITAALNKKRKGR